MDKQCKTQYALEDAIRYRKEGKLDRAIESLIEALVYTNGWEAELGSHYSDYPVTFKPLVDDKEV